MEGPAFTAQTFETPPNTVLQEAVIATSNPYALWTLYTDDDFAYVWAYNYFFPILLNFNLANDIARVTISRTGGTKDFTIFVSPRGNAAYALGCELFGIFNCKVTRVTVGSNVTEIAGFVSDIQPSIAATKTLLVMLFCETGPDLQRKCNIASITNPEIITPEFALFPCLTPDVPCIGVCDY